ncbi:hypothetical protein CP082626L3_0704B, partial [Chlamydia psittaci 08-2626_L3]
SIVKGFLIGFFGI